MVIAKAGSIALVGMEAHPVEVEVSIASGLPTFTIVGLPDPSIQEARERVRAAIQAASEQWPQQRITVNLSPAHLRKTGSGFDLAMALGVLAANRTIAADRLAGICVLGELSLDGTVRRVRGALPAAMAAARAGMRSMLVPAANAREAALAGGAEVLPVDHLGQAVRFLRGECSIPAWAGGPAPVLLEDVPDLSEVRGQTIAKKALEIAAAGGHNLLMVGPPGAGKTMLARRLPGILPPMTREEAFEVTRIWSVAGLLPDEGGLLRRRPFRAPHHTGSTTGLIGGGSGMPHPGECSLAHRGVLFLDELGEFRREALQALRQPIEDGHVTIVRSRWAVTFPARFQLVAASNPCGCGYAGDRSKQCGCSAGRLAAYQERLSGPILDRIDLQVPVSRLSRREVFGGAEGDGSETVAARVAAARARQAERFAPLGLVCNADLPARELERLCPVTARGRRLIEDSVERKAMSARGVHRTIRVARTIADLAGAEEIDDDAVEAALSYRVLEARR